MLKYRSPWSGHEMDAALVRNEYANNGRMYLGLYTHDAECDFWEPWSDVTVNLPDEPITDKDCGFVDINNNPALSQFIEENYLGERTGKYGRSGFCTYPEYRFNMERLAEHLLKV